MVYGITCEINSFGDSGGSLNHKKYTKKLKKPARNNFAAMVGLSLRAGPSLRPGMAIS